MGTCGGAGQRLHFLSEQSTDGHVHKRDASLLSTAALRWVPLAHLSEDGGVHESAIRRASHVPAELLHQQPTLGALASARTADEEEEGRRGGDSGAE